MSGRSIHLIDRDELLATLEQDIDVSVTGAEKMEAVRKCLQEVLDDVRNSPEVDAVPVPFIEEMIKRFRDIADYAFVDNGGYFDGSHYELWALEMLLTEWRESIAGREEE